MGLLGYSFVGDCVPSTVVIFSFYLQNLHVKPLCGVVMMSRRGDRKYVWSLPMRLSGFEECDKGLSPGHCDSVSHVLMTVPFLMC